jgi:hypothetical protein
MGVRVVRLGEVDAEHDRHIRALARRRDDHLACTGLEVTGGRFAGPEAARALDHDLRVELAPGQRGGIAARADRDPLAGDDDRVAVLLERRVAGAEDHVAFDLDAELRAQGRLDVDLAEDAEAFRLQLRPRALDGLVEAERRLRAERVAGLDGHAARSSSRRRVFSAFSRCASAPGGSLKARSR